MGKWMDACFRLSYKYANVNVNVNVNADANANAIRTSQFGFCLAPFHRTTRFFFLFAIQQRGQDALHYWHGYQCHQEVVSLGTFFNGACLHLNLDLLAFIGATNKTEENNNTTQYKQHTIGNQRGMIFQGSCHGIFASVHLPVCLSVYSLPAQ